MKQIPFPTVDSPTCTLLPTGGPFWYYSRIPPDGSLTLIEHMVKEGSEWDMFETASEETLKKCDNISIEQHEIPEHPELLKNLIHKLQQTHTVKYHGGASILAWRTPLNDTI